MLWSQNIILPLLSCGGHHNIIDIHLKSYSPGSAWWTEICLACALWAGLRWVSMATSVGFYIQNWELGCHLVLWLRQQNISPAWSWLEYGEDISHLIFCSCGVSGKPSCRIWLQQDSPKWFAQTLPDIASDIRGDLKHRVWQPFISWVSS